MQCREPYTADADQKRALGSLESADTTLYRAKGCPACGHTGYRGRAGIYELLSVDDALRKRIHDHAPENVFNQHLIQGGHSLGQDGRARVLAGETSLEELARVTL